MEKPIDRRLPRFARLSPKLRFTCVNGKGSRTFCTKSYELVMSLSFTRRLCHTTQWLLDCLD